MSVTATCARSAVYGQTLAMILVQCVNVGLIDRCLRVVIVPGGPAALSGGGDKNEHPELLSYRLSYRLSPYLMLVPCV